MKNKKIFFKYKKKTLVFKMNVFFINQYIKVLFSTKYNYSRQIEINEKPGAIWIIS